MAYTAIFGGTFNPPHIGHYQMLSALENSDKIEKILLMPDRIPPHKVCDFLADDSDRIEMCRLLSEDFSKSELCLIEFERQGKSYSYDTVLLLKERFPETEFAFVCGGDMLMFFEKWYRFEDLMKLVPFIIFGRSDIMPEDFEMELKRLKAMGMDIMLMNEKITAAASSKIRIDIEKSSKLLPYKIYEYIKGKGIYSAGRL